MALEPAFSIPISRRTALVAAGALVLGTTLAIQPHRTFAYQAATPAVEGGAEIDGAPGVWAEVFSGVPSLRAPEQTLYLARFTFLPNSEIYPHSHPGSTSLSVESGTFGWTLVAGKASVIRGAKAGKTEVEVVDEVGVEVVLDPGDAIFYEDDVTHTARSLADGPAVVNAALILTAGEPLLMEMEH